MFIKNISGIFAPTIETIKKDIQTFCWIKTTERICQLLKKNITEKLVLKPPNFNHLFQARCDVSGTTIGEILSQEGSFVAYSSERLSVSKKKDSSYDKEFYAKVQELKHWWLYLMPNDFFFLL